MGEITLASSVMLFIVVQSANMGLWRLWFWRKVMSHCLRLRSTALTAVWSWQMQRDPGATEVHANSPVPAASVVPRVGPGHFSWVAPVTLTAKCVHITDSRHRFCRLWSLA